jgi:hypothetical protein
MSRDWQRLPRHRAELSPEALLALVRQVLAGGGSLWVGAHGPSMSPTVREGDQVLLVPSGDVRRGDVVLAEVSGRGVLHRVVRCDPTHVWTAGDGVPCADPPRPRSSVVARAIARERGGRVTALARDAELGALPLARGLWWTMRLGLARRVRAARSARGTPAGAVR